MKTLAAVAILLLSGLAWAEESNEVNLVVGGQKVISAGGVQSYSEGAPGIVQIKVPEDGRKIVITAIRPGSTTLLLIFNNGKSETYVINVFARSPEGIRRELKGMLSNLPAVELREVGGRIFLDGAVPSQEDLARIDRLIALYAGQVASLVKK